MRTRGFRANPEPYKFPVGMKPLSERDENFAIALAL